MSSSKKKFVRLAEEIVTSSFNHDLVINEGVLASSELGVDKLAEVRALRECVMLRCIKVRDGDYSAQDLELVGKWYKVWFSTPQFVDTSGQWKVQSTEPMQKGNDECGHDIGFRFTWKEELSNGWMSNIFKEVESYIASCFHDNIQNDPERLEQWAEAGRQVLSLGVDLKLHFRTSRGFCKQLFYDYICFPAESLFGSLISDFRTEFYRDVTHPMDSDFEPEPQVCVGDETFLFGQVTDAELPRVSPGQTSQDDSLTDAFLALVRSRMDVCIISGYEYSLLIVLDLDNYVEVQSRNQYGTSHNSGRRGTRLMTVPLRYRVIQHDDNSFPLTAIYASMCYWSLKRTARERLDRKRKLDELWNVIHTGDSI